MTVGGFGVSVHWTLTSLETIVTEAEYGEPLPTVMEDLVSLKPWMAGSDHL